jgi:predicted nucleic acid-binding protein
MKLAFDTSILIDIDQGREEAQKLMKKLVEEGHEIHISSVVVAEVLAGAYRHDSVEDAKRVLGQFQWLDMNGETADRAGKMMAELLENGDRIEFQDTVIAASAEQISADALVTRNTKHFERIDFDTEILNPEKLEEEIE